jgi:hypothetical protein
MRALLILCALAGIARADNVAVGLFVPTAPFTSTAARVDLASKLGDHLGKGVGGNGSGRAFARASDFASAVKKGDVTVALVDATYLAAAGGNYAIVATAVRAGETSQSWQLVARSATKIGDLRGKHLLVPSTGGRETDFVLNVLLGGEVTRDFFGKIEAAPDTSSTLAALGLGKADAAVVPSGVDLPAGTTKLLTLTTLSAPVLVAYGSTTPAQRAALAAAASTFKSDGAITGFRVDGDDGVRGIQRRFSVPVKRGPLVVPAVRLLVGDLVEGRTFAIERAPATSFVAK